MSKARAIVDTLAQAIISTTPTAASKMNSVGRALPIMKSCRQAGDVDAAAGVGDGVLPFEKCGS